MIIETFLLRKLNLNVFVPILMISNFRDYIDLTCTFAFNSSEIKQLDVKWYFQVEQLDIK